MGLDLIRGCMGNAEEGLIGKERDWIFFVACHMLKRVKEARKGIGSL